MPPCTLEKQADYLKNKYGAAIFFYTALPCLSPSQELRNDKAMEPEFMIWFPDSVERFYIQRTRPVSNILTVGRIHYDNRTDHHTA